MKSIALGLLAGTVPLALQFPEVKAAPRILHAFGRRWNHLRQGALLSPAGEYPATLIRQESSLQEETMARGCATLKEDLSQDVAKGCQFVARSLSTGLIQIGAMTDSEQAPTRIAGDDATDCANYLFRVRTGDDWRRFDAATDDFLAKHKDRLATSTLRQLLSGAYTAAAPEDYAGQQRILGQ